jgi:hypothetical protein
MLHQAARKKKRNAFEKRKEETDRNVSGEEDPAVTSA